VPALSGLAQLLITSESSASTRGSLIRSEGCNSTCTKSSSCSTRRGGREAEGVGEGEGRAEAERLLRRALTEEPENAAHVSMRQHTSACVSIRQEAEGLLRRALAEEPENADVLCMLGALLSDEDQPAAWAGGGGSHSEEGAGERREGGRERRGDKVRGDEVKRHVA
jgi:hypothetical protein